MTESDLILLADAEIDAVSGGSDFIPLGGDRFPNPTVCRTQNAFTLD